MTIPLKHRPEGLGEFEPGDVVPFEHGGTNASSLIDAQNNLGINSKAEQASVDALQTDLENLTDEVGTKADAIAVSQALALKADLVDGKVPASQLPSYVDDVLEGRYVDPATFNDLDGNPYTPESGKLYVDIDTNRTYRWSGMLYVSIGGGGVVLGETSDTAYRGDRGKIAYDHSLSQGNPHNSTTSDIPEGTRLYFTEARTRATVLAGLNITNSSDVGSGDSVLTGIGKLQAKFGIFDNLVRAATLALIDISPTTTTVNGLDTVLTGIGKLQGQITSDKTWVSVKTLTGITWHSSIDVANSTIEVAKIGGNLWLRGWLKQTGSIPSGGIPIVFWTQATWQMNVTGMGYPANYYHIGGIATTVTTASDTSYYRLSARQQVGLINNGTYLAVDSAVTGTGIMAIAPFCMGRAM